MLGYGYNNTMCFDRWVQVTTHWSMREPWICGSGQCGSGQYRSGQSEHVRTQLALLAETDFLAGVDSLLYKKLSYRRWTARCVVSVEICQLPRNSAESTCTTSPEQIEVMKLKRYSRPKAMCNKHVHSTMTRSSRFRCPVGVINKTTTVELWISPVYRWLAVVKFSRSTM